MLSYLRAMMLNTCALLSRTTPSLSSSRPFRDAAIPVHTYIYALISRDHIVPHPPSLRADARFSLLCMTSARRSNACCRTASSALLSSRFCRFSVEMFIISISNFLLICHDQMHCTHHILQNTCVNRFMMVLQSHQFW